MKTLTLTALLLITTLLSFAQEVNLVAKINYSNVNNGNITSKDKLEFYEGSDLKFKLIFNNVDAAAKAVLDAGKFQLEGETATTITSAVPYDGSHYSITNQTFTIDLSVPLSGYGWENNANKTTVRVLKNNGTSDLHILSVERKLKKADPITLSKTENQLHIQRYFDAKIFDLANKTSKGKLKLSLKRNALVDDNDIIHLFMDAYGKFYGSGMPTSAIQDNRFQFHILLVGAQLQEYSFDAIYTGEYQPELLSILNTADKPASATNGKKEDNVITITEWNGAIKGPYTNEFSVEITRKEGSVSEKIVDATIRIAKLYHVSISTGLLFTSLKNPQNIETATLASGETTLIADDPRDRGVLTIMATYYPWGRSFLFPPSGGAFDHSRFGVQVGTKLGDDLAENFFIGLSHDFARGGAFTYGIHYGRRNYVAGASDFDFGKDVFDLPELNVKQEWGLGFYVGVVIDTRVAIELIKSLGGNN